MSFTNIVFLKLMCFVVSKSIGCKHVQAMFIDMKEAKPGTLGLLVSQLVGDEICTSQEASRSSCMCFYICNCVHPNCTSLRGQIVFFMPPYLYPAPCSLLTQSSHCKMELQVTRTSLGYLDVIKLVWKECYSIEQHAWFLASPLTHCSSLAIPPSDWCISQHFFMGKANRLKACTYRGFPLFSPT